EPRRTLATIVGSGLAAALLIAVLSFGQASGTTATRRALADVPVDAQAVLAAGADVNAVTTRIKADPAVAGLLAFDLVHADHATMTAASGATETSGAVIVGVDPSYTTTTGLFGVSAGAAKPGEALVSRDLATNLGAVPGDTIRFQLAGGAQTDLRVSGIVDITRADLILGPTDAAHRAAGANPPTNVAITDLATVRTIEAKVPPGTQAADPSSTPTAPTGGPVAAVASEPAVRRELQIRYDHAQLPGDPTAAGRWLDDVRRRIERDLAGQVTIVDDARATLEPVAGDLIWGQILFIFLALPGVALALALSRFAAESEAEATRRHAALLRARGASDRQLAIVFLAATAMAAAVGVVVGAVGGILLALALVGPSLAAAGGPIADILVIVGAMVAVVLLSVLVAATALRAQLRGEIATWRQVVERPKPPRWQRAYLDILALVGAVVAFVALGGTGIHPVLDAEGNPTISLSLAAFVAPFLLWVGGTLLLLRLVTMLTARRAMAGTLQRSLGVAGELAGHSLSARSRATARIVVLLALAVSFATSVLIFDATYRQQQRVDAELTLGADLRATPTGAADPSALATVAGPDIASVSPFSDRIVYVGAEAQDLLAIDPATLPATAPLSDSFFKGSTANDAIAALAARPDAILVSAETAKDYSIVPGDHLKIRVPDRNGNLVDVDFTMAGIALEFPTAPKDAFLVGNLSYVTQKTGDPRITAIMARTTTDGAAASVAQRLGPTWNVTDISTTNARLANAVTSVDLSGLVAIDIAFAVAIASIGIILYLQAGLSERRVEFATLVAIGAEARQIRATIGAEVAAIGLTGLASGLITGGLVGATLLVILVGVFDPPADLPVVPGFAVAGLVVIVAL
ncbi:MAG TPA: ABC transporter permease, partial [Candidatus Bathyarchaeia archaeon]|nr:ABC transporter permease [Candidatus Bathyarchaeia archaeon]